MSVPQNGGHAQYLPFYIHNLKGRIVHHHHSLSSNISPELTTDVSCRSHLQSWRQEKGCDLRSLRNQQGDNLRADVNSLHAEKVTTS